MKGQEERREGDREVEDRQEVRREGRRKMRIMKDGGQEEEYNMEGDGGKR